MNQAKRFASLANNESSKLIRRQKAGSLPILSPAGTLRLREVIGQTSWCAFLFVFVLLMKSCNLRFHHQTAADVITWIVIIAVWVWPIVCVILYTVGMWRTISVSVARASACIYWMYWPLVRLVAVVVAVGLACSYGDTLWYDHFQLYEEYYRLQAYDNVDPRTITGSRLQDAGLVRFNNSAGVDRSKAGCIINGKTFCVAPIVDGGQVKPSPYKTSPGVQDLYVAGVDCCNCPVTDFRCGDWDDQSGKLGGMRLFDKENARMFRLAAEKFSASYGKVMMHGVFFEWANDPITTWKKLWLDGFHLLCLYLIFGVLGSFLIMVSLNGFMRMLCHYGLAAPIDENPPRLPGLHWMDGDMEHRRGFIPNEYHNYLHQWDPADWGTRIQNADQKFVLL